MFPALMPYHNIWEMIADYRERDALLILLLVVIGICYWVADNATKRLEEYHRANPGAKQMYDAWLREQRLRMARTGRPTSVFCPLHRVPRDECQAKHEEEP